ncbi:MAG: hypothetical protein B5M51_03920 [Anaerolinea sp. 4484_236]|nr:MAG: hypothetical protein B5M51_03920 [Anaerolinea sp. 4484_236]
MRIKIYLTLSILLLLTALTGCTLSQTDTSDATATLGLPPFTQTPPPPSATPAIAGASPLTTPAPGETPVSVSPAGGANIPGLSAVILLPLGEELNIRAAAGTENRVVGTFPATAANVFRTGPTTRVGEDVWAEVNLPGGGTGWVNARYLTEYVPAATFCADSHIQLLLDELEVALQTADGDLFASLVSQAHGLDLRYWRHGTLANYTPAEAAWAFKSDYIVNWGNEPGSGFEKIGTFSEIPLPKLLEVFTANYELHCNVSLL